MNHKSESRVNAITKEFEEDIAAIEQDGDNDETAKDLLKRERRAAFFQNMLDWHNERNPAAATVSAASILVREQTKYKLVSCASADIWQYADRALDALTTSKTSWTKDQIRMQTTEMQRLEITNAMEAYTSADGDYIMDAAQWMEWGDNAKLALLLKEVFPKTAAPTDQQKLQTLHFEITCLAQPRNTGKFVAEAQALLSWEDRKDELNALSQSAFHKLAEVFVDKVIGKRQLSCKVTAELVAKIKARKGPKFYGRIVCSYYASRKGIL